MKKIHILFLTVVCFAFALSGKAQDNNEFKQRINGFVASADSAYTKKELNLNDQNLGAIGEQDHDWTTTFMLKTKERSENNIGNNSFGKYYFSFYTYPDVTERDYAMKFWLQKFIDNVAVRPGRTMRTYPHAQPTIIVINETNIAILTYSCNWFDYDTFDDWRKSMLTWFGSPASVIIEVGCDGPLEWTKNAPDSKDRTWR